MSDPAQVMREIAADIRALDAGGKRLGEALRELGGDWREQDGERVLVPGVAHTYQDLIDAEIEKIENDSGGDKKRPPEDVRESLARRRIKEHDPLLAAKKTALEHEVEALKKWINLKASTLSGRQTYLNGLKAETRAADVPQPAWTRDAA